PGIRRGVVPLTDLNHQATGPDRRALGRTVWLSLKHSWLPGIVRIAGARCGERIAGSDFRKRGAGRQGHRLSFVEAILLGAPPGVPDHFRNPEDSTLKRSTPSSIRERMKKASGSSSTAPYSPTFDGERALWVANSSAFRVTLWTPAFEVVSSGISPAPVIPPA